MFVIHRIRRRYRHYDQRIEPQTADRLHGHGRARPCLQGTGRRPHPLSGINAKMENGILHIVLPKVTEEEKKALAQTIQIC